MADPSPIESSLTTDTASSNDTWRLRPAICRGGVGHECERTCAEEVLSERCDNRLWVPGACMGEVTALGLRNRDFLYLSETEGGLWGQHLTQRSRGEGTREGLRGESGGATSVVYKSGGVKSASGEGESSSHKRCVQMRMSERVLNPHQVSVSVE